MTEVDRAAAAEVLVRFFGDLDAARYDALVTLTTDDVIWTRLNRPLTGHQAILDALALRDPTRRTCHVLTNFVVDPIAGGVRLTALMLAFHGKPPDGGGSIPLDGIAAIRAITAELQTTARGYLVHRLADTPMFAALVPHS